MAEKQQAIAEYFDKTVAVMEDLFGEHLHFGYYEPGATATMASQPEALIRLIDEALRFANFSDDAAKKPRNMLDVGCGIGGTCLYLAKKYDIQCKGINISPEEVKIGQHLAAVQGLESKVSFDVGDALDMPYPDGTFDMVLSIQSMEHIQDKEKLFSEMVRVAAPGGAIFIVSYAHRNLSPSEKSLKPQEQQVLQKLCSATHPTWFCPSSQYVPWLTRLPVKDIKMADWSENVAPFVTLMFNVAFSLKAIVSSLIKGGWKAVKEALELKVMAKAADDGLLKCVALTCRKSK